MSKNHESQQPDLRTPLLGPAAEASTKSVVERLCIDEMLSKYCGEFGQWQLRHFVLTSMAWALEAFHTMVVIFADREPTWRCTEAGAAGGCSAGAKSVCQMEAGSWEWVGGRGSSTVSEFGLICSEKYKVGLVQAVFFAGCMIG